VIGERHGGVVPNVEPPRRTGARILDSPSGGTYYVTGEEETRVDHRCRI
jgi:hypothetical protein